MTSILAKHVYRDMSTVRDTGIVAVHVNHLNVSTTAGENGKLVFL